MKPVTLNPKGQPSEVHCEARPRHALLHLPGVLRTQDHDLAFKESFVALRVQVWFRVFKFRV